MYAGKVKKYLLLPLTVCLILLFCVLPAAAQSSAQWVQDGYPLFSESEVQALDGLCQAFYDKNGIPIFILTVDSAAVGSSADNAVIAYIEDYADRQIRGDCIGMIINMETRYMYIDVKCDLAETRERMTDRRQEMVRSAVMDRLSEGNWYQAACDFVSMADAAYNGQSGSAASAEDRAENRLIFTGFSGLLAAIFTGTAYKARSSKHREKRIAVSAQPYVVGGNIHLTRREDDFIRSYTTQVRKQSDSGGTSTHTSSGGHSHSGGGGHF